MSCLVATYLLHFRFTEALRSKIQINSSSDDAPQTSYACAFSVSSIDPSFAYYLFRSTYDYRFPPIFALIIGIDIYPNTEKHLKGAVFDAVRFNTFLSSKCGVPSHQIRNLRNGEATRKQIIAELEYLSSNDKIPIGAAIIIFFAGHGARNKVPKEWKEWIAADDMIEGICPQDILAGDGNKKPITAIPDRTIACLLDEISRAKGDNIVSHPSLWQFYCLCH